jgi:hypothetical protein
VSWLGISRRRDRGECPHPHSGPDPVPAVEVAEYGARLLRERDRAVAELVAERKRVADLLLDLAALRGLKGGEEAARWRRQAEQDRRNCVVLSDALALAEGRRVPVGYRWEGSADPEAARLREAVRATVAEVLGVDLSEVASC